MFINRIRKTGELLTYIRTLKMYGWEILFSNWLMETRSSEVMHLSVWRLIYEFPRVIQKILYHSFLHTLGLVFNSTVWSVLLDTEVLGCVVCILLGYNANPVLSFHIWSLHINGTSTWCCNGILTIPQASVVVHCISGLFN